MAKYNFYAVAKGVDPSTGKEVTNKIFTNWEECKPYIKGINNARYKGFLTESEATLWLQKFTTEEENNNKESDKVEEIIDDIISNISKNNSTSPVDNRFNEICKELNVDTFIMLNHLKRQFIETYSFVKPSLPWD